MKVVTLILAGGKGERLQPLTARRAKPAVPFGGGLRLVDFTLLNCAASGLEAPWLLTQHAQTSIARHLAERWRGRGIEMLGSGGEQGLYGGTADAVRHHLDRIEAARPDAVLVLSGDHVYRADYARLLFWHLTRRAGATVLTGDVSVAEASQFGVVELAPLTSRGGQVSNEQVRRFVEKPADPTPWSAGGRCPINLGVYCFDPRLLRELLGTDPDRVRDFGHHVLPAAAAQGALHACPLGAVSPDARPYWRDVGTVDSYFAASLDLVGSAPRFDLADPRFTDGSLQRLLPRRIAVRTRVGTRIVEGSNLIARDAVVESRNVVDSIVFPGAHVGPACELEQCIVLPGAVIGARTKLRRAIVEEGVQVATGARREDLVSPRRVTSHGVLVVTGEPRPVASLPMAMTA